MKNKYIFPSLALAAVTLISACDKSGYDGDRPEANLFINLAIDSGVDTRTSGSKVDSALVIEKEIKSLRLFLVKCSSTGTPDATAEVVEIGENSINLDGSSANTSISSTNGDYQLLYVLANCPSSITISKTNYSSFIGSYKEAFSSVADIWKDSSFFMVNSYDGNKTVLNGQVCYNGGVLVNCANQSNSVNVVLERLAAKIVADQDKFIDFSAEYQKVLGNAADGKDYVISSAKIDAWALMNCVNRFNLIQKFTKDTKDFHKANTADKLCDVIVTPSSDAENYPVAKRTGSSNNLALDDYYYYTNPEFTGFDNGVPTYKDLKFVDAGKTLYCLENNPSYFPDNYIKYNGSRPTASVSDSKMKGRSTAVIFRARILLADGFDANAGTGSNGGTDPVGEDGNKGTWDNPPTKAYDNNIVKTVYSYKGKYYADLTRLTTDNTALASCTDNAALRAAGVKVYENGYMYYTYYLSKTEIPGCHSPYYCVERNKCYRLTVKAVSGLGDDLPCDFNNYDPEDPVDMAIPRLKVTVDVLPWNVKETVTYEIQ